jgi:hypothetical protein
MQVTERVRVEDDTDRKGRPMSKVGLSLLRATLFRAADTARRQDPQLARIYYQQMTERGANHPGSSGASEIRILFVFDPWRSAILLVAGDKAGKWSRWYAEAIPHAEQLYEIYLKERAEEETGR